MSASSEFRKTFQISALKDIYFSSVKYNSAIGIDRINTRVFERSLEENIAVIRRKSLSGTYKFSQYREKLISRGADKCPRVISIPTLRDKLTLKALYKILFSVYGTNIPYLHKVISDVNRSVASGKYDEVLRLDVKDFYPSVRHDLLLIQLSKKVRNKQVVHLVTNSISRQTVSKPISEKKQYISVGIPQGLPISNILANVYMQPIDHKYKKRTSIKYFRYVDDILILCNYQNAKKIMSELIDDCKKLNLDLHDNDPSKIYAGKLSSKFSYLGYVFIDKTVTVRKKSLDKLRESIIKTLTSYKYSRIKNQKILRWALNLRITGCRFNDTKYGWMFFFSQIDDEQLLSSLDHFVKKQLIRFNLDPSTIKIKKFTRAYHEITKNLNNSKYIPNFDVLKFREKQNILSEIFDINVSKMDSHEIEYKFRQLIFRTVRELEKDLSRLS